MPYRTPAPIIMDKPQKPRWRLVQRWVGGFSFDYKYKIQRRILWFWITVDWFYNLDKAKKCFDTRVNPIICEK